MKAGSNVICPPTPPSWSPPHLRTPSLESSGSESASSVDEVSKKRKLGSGASASAMAKVAFSASRSPPLVSPKQPVPSPQEKELASTTTFVQTDTSSFRDLVQKLTGASDSDMEKLPITLPSRQSAARGGAIESSETHKYDNSFRGGLIPKPVFDMSARRPSFKLHERRRSNLRKLEINRLGATAAAFNRGLLPPSTQLSTPSNKQFSTPAGSSPVTPLTMEHFEKAYAPKTPTPYEVGRKGLKSRSQNLEKDRGKDIIHFLLHPSPSSDSTRPQPELLSLFPLTSPHISSEMQSSNFGPNLSSKGKNFIASHQHQHVFL